MRIDGFSAPLMREYTATRQSQMLPHAPARHVTCGGATMRWLSHRPMAVFCSLWEQPSWASGSAVGFCSAPLFVHPCASCPHPWTHPPGLSPLSP